MEGNNKFQPIVKLEHRLLHYGQIVKSAVLNLKFYQGVKEAKSMKKLTHISLFYALLLGVTMLINSCKRELVIQNKSQLHVTLPF